MREIPLSRGLVALVDDEDYSLVCVWKWAPSVRDTNTYAVSATLWAYTGTYPMHQLIMGKDYMYDHIDGNGLNNQRSNLRPCTNSENGRNKRANRSSSSGFKGVHWNTRRQIWKATIEKDGVKRYLGRFDTAEEGAHAYDEAAIRLFGEFAKTNFPRE